MRAACHRARRGRVVVLSHDCWNHNILFHALKKKTYYVPWWGIFWWMPKYEKMGTGELFQVLYLVALGMLDSQPGEKPLSPEFRRITGLDTQDPVYISISLQFTSSVSPQFTLFSPLLPYASEHLGPNPQEVLIQVTHWPVLE